MSLFIYPLMPVQLIPLRPSMGEATTPIFAQARAFSRVDRHLEVGWLVTERMHFNLPNRSVEELAFPHLLTNNNTPPSHTALITCQTLSQHLT